MTKYIKYLISFLLILGLTVNEGAHFVQTKATNHDQISSVFKSEDVSSENSETYVFNRHVCSEEIHSILFIAFQSLRDVSTTKTQDILKIQNRLYQKIHLKIAESKFLNNITFSSNHDPSLYRA